MSPPFRVLLVLLACTAACSGRTEPHSDLGRQLAEHLCPIQADCGCEEELIIPDCEARVEREMLATEREALAAGLVLDEACFEDHIEHIDRVAACGRPDVALGSICPVYTAHAGVGEQCEIFDFLPWVSQCRAGLYCIQGTCRDLANPYLLYEGEVCADVGLHPSTGAPPECAEGLICDGEDTRTCVPSPYLPPVPTGGQCTTPLSCVDGSYCLPQDLEDGPSEEVPGTCVLRTPDGEPCSVLIECATRCIDGICETPQPKLCETLELWWAREQL
jgi:hypothetical protein